jgi:hypothetical protein
MSVIKERKKSFTQTMLLPFVAQTALLQLEDNLTTAAFTTTTLALQKARVFFKREENFLLKTH